jgi:rhodanese-related sulfurtransferase
MKKLNSLMLGILFAMFIFTGCKDDDTQVIPPVVVNESEVLATYLESANSPLGKDFVNTDMPTVIAATDVYTLTQTNQVYIIDIRTAADFATGHIQNAVNVTFANLLTHIKSVDLTNYTKVVIACYTGQTAGYGASLLRLLGYNKVYSLKWGMSSWHADFAGKWNTAVSNMYATQFTTTASAKAAIGSLPTLTTGKTTGQEILEARVNALLVEGFTPATVTNATVFGALSNYYIVNYWPENQYLIGHIPGAIQYTPKASIKLAADLKTLPTNKPVAVYCYTGQTSAYLVAYLRLLGYDAKTIMYGTNGMIWDMMVANSIAPTFGPTEIKGYTYVQ